jgi:hypothetical protein
METPARYRADCEFCGHPLDVRVEGVHQAISSGWVRNRTAGGANGVSLIKRENQWAHELCVERAVKGTLAQTDLF